MAVPLIRIKKKCGGLYLSRWRLQNLETSLHCADNRVERFQSWVFFVDLFFFSISRTKNPRDDDKIIETAPSLSVSLSLCYNRHSSNISLGGCQATPPLNSSLTHKSNASDWCLHRSNRFHYHIKASCLQSLSESSRSQQEPGWPCATYKIVASSFYEITVI